MLKTNLLTGIPIKCKTNIASSLLKGLALDVEVSENFGGDKTVEEARVVVAGLVSSVGRVPVC